MRRFDYSCGHSLREVILEVDALLVLAGIIVARVVELAIVVLVVKGIPDSVGGTEEVPHGDGVGGVQVQVVLEVLKHVHILLDKGVAADTWEGEGLIVEVPGADLELGSLAGLRHSSSDVVCVGPVAGIKGAREHLTLVVQLLLGLVEVDARSVELEEGGILDAASLVKVDGGGSAKQESNSEELHVKIIKKIY